MMPIVHANGAAIPVLGLGTWDLRGQVAVAAVQAALASGYRHLDTAAMYGNEAEVGEGLRASGMARDAVFVTTKVWRDDLAPERLLASARASLAQLRLEAVDLLLIHWPNEAIPLAETLGALAEARRLGLARHVGVSNFPVAMLERAVALCEAPLCANQVEYHPRLPQPALLAACRQLGLALTAYCPLGRGDLVADPAVAAVAAARGRSPAQILLRWHVQQPGVVAIPRSSTAAHIAQNAAVFDFELTDAEVARLSALGRRPVRTVDPAFAPEWDRATA